MARIRYLKPDFFKDEDLAILPFETRLCFAGLWNFADKAGRLEDRPQRLKIEIFPYDKLDIDKCLDALSKPKNGSGRPFIYRYIVNDEKYIQILSWEKHQKPHHTETDSIIPPPITPLIKDNRKIKESVHDGIAPLTDGLITVSKPLVNGKSFDFASIWDKYPKKLGRKAAERHFTATVKTEKDFSDISRALANFLVSKVCLGDPQYIPHGSTWFNNWSDWVDYKEPENEFSKEKDKEDEIDRLIKGVKK